MINSPRTKSIDALRGLVVILMALDHTQFFWFSFGLPNDGLSGYIPQYLNSFHQLTRFLSHMCAPTFLFLAGMMMAWTLKKRNLFLRGLTLILLQFTLENMAWWPMDYLASGYAYFGILSCLGFSMCIFSMLSFLKPYWFLAFGIAILVLPQFSSLAVPNAHPLLQSLAIILYAPTLNHLYPMTGLFTLIPWMGFMGLGFFLGSKTQNRDLSQYKIIFCLASLALITAAFILRYLNGFGNFLHWYGTPFGSDFFILSKYPPSLVFILFTLGIMFLVWSVFIYYESKLNLRIFHPLITFGQTSLFFYVVHLYVYGSVAYYYGHNVQLNLAQTWIVWFVGLIVMYFLCLGYMISKVCIHSETVHI